MKIQGALMEIKSMSPVYQDSVVIINLPVQKSMVYGDAFIVITTVLSHCESATYTVVQDLLA